MEELDSKPGIKQIREKQLVQKNEKIRETETKDSYIWYFSTSSLLFNFW